MDRRRSDARGCQGGRGGWIPPADWAVVDGRGVGVLSGPGSFQPPRGLKGGVGWVGEIGENHGALRAPESSS